MLIAVTGCGSSKPGYCADRTHLENSIKGLTSLNVSSGVSGLKTQLQKISSDATTLVNSAKSDFPSQTSAIKSSLKTFENAVKGLPSRPSASQIASVASSASGVVSSVQKFVTDSKSKCS